MKKAYVLAAAICLVLAVAVTAFFSSRLNKENPLADSSYLFAIEESAGFYLKDNPGAKPSTNEEWVRALRHTDYDKFDVQDGPSTLELDEIVSESGKFMTPSGYDITFKKNEDGSLTVSSPGADGQPGTSDDIGSSDFRNSMK